MWTLLLTLRLAHKDWFFWLPIAPGRPENPITNHVIIQVNYLIM